MYCFLLTIQEVYLNPIDMIWAEVKILVSSITPDDWKSRCTHVKNVDKEYTAKVPAIDDMTEEFIIHFGSSSENDGSSEELSDMSGIEEL